MLVTGYIHSYSWIIPAYVLGKMFAGIRNKHKKNLNYKYQCDLSPGK